MPGSRYRPGRGVGTGPLNAGIRIDGFAELLRDLKRYEPEVNKSFRKRLKNAVDKVAKDAARRAPRKSGGLAKKIRPSVTGKGVAVISKAEHARITEFGGRHPVFGNRENWVFQPARPHVFPAVEAGRKEVETEALAALDEAARTIGFS